MVKFILVQALSRSNSPMSSFIALCCGLLCLLDAWLCCMCPSVCPRCIMGCYFYSQENRLIDMASFQLCYNLNKHTSD
jgi:hypothetical protein